MLQESNKNDRLSIPFLRKQKCCDHNISIQFYSLKKNHMLTLTYHNGL